ncbi:DUF4350 domain-containing protein [Dactylosporangium sp. NPDC051485]|uniref:DUF4350 domain-containing protein n=1 Tax=Dactylosporangium sp. NPDC051485 TaxID=3154846 RepID=UPI0034276FE2
MTEPTNEPLTSATATGPETATPAGAETAEPGGAGPRLTAPAEAATTGAATTEAGIVGPSTAKAATAGAGTDGPGTDGPGDGVSAGPTIRAATEPARRATGRAVGTGAGKARGPRSRRWLRLVVPVVAAIVLILLGIVVYQVGQPGLSDADYLSPGSRADIGAAELAGRVREAGVTIIPEHSTSDALVAAYNGNATLLITTPQLVHPLYLRMLKVLPASTRVVIVEPDAAAVIDGRLPFEALHRNYTAKAPEPGCGYGPAAQAGAAAVGRSSYGEVDPTLGRETQRCYGGSLVVYQRESTTVTVVGAADPFRNDRIGERGNARLATGLLTGAPRLIWLDLHHREPPPIVIDDPALNGAPVAPASLRPVQPSDPDERDFPRERRTPIPRPPVGGASIPAGQDNDGGSPPNPLWVAFPKWVYPTTALLLVGVVLLTVAGARRLGAPVVEPLPVVVRSSETATGRGRLYQRARARPEAIQILREAALGRMARLLRLDPDGDRTALVETVAARSGWPAAAVGHTLFGPAPANDADLVAAAATLDQLVSAIATEQAAAPGEGLVSAVATQQAASPGAGLPGANSTASNDQAVTEGESR